MAKATGISLRSVQRIWQAHKLQPHRIRTFKRSNDPAFAAKLEDIVGLYLDPPKHAIVLSVDDISEDDFNVVSNTHAIISGAGLSLGSIDVGNPVFVDSISTLNHHVDVLLTTLASRAVLVSHKEYPLVYFGWYRMPQASSGSVLFDLLVQSANWTFSGP